MGCLGKKIEPYMVISEINFFGDRAIARGEIQPENIIFQAELIDHGQGASFQIEQLILRKER